MRYYKDVKPKYVIKKQDRKQFDEDAKRRHDIWLKNLDAVFNNYQEPSENMFTIIKPTKFQQIYKRLSRSIFLQSFLLCTIAICVMGWIGATHEQTIIDFLMMFDNDFRYIPWLLGRHLRVSSFFCVQKKPVLRVALSL